MSAAKDAKPHVSVQFVEACLVLEATVAWAPQVLRAALARAPFYANKLFVSAIVFVGGRGRP